MLSASHAELNSGVGHTCTGRTLGCFEVKAGFQIDPIWFGVFYLDMFKDAKRGKLRILAPSRPVELSS